MNKLEDLSVVLTGNPVLSALQISNILEVPHKDIELILPLLRGMVHVFEFKKDVEMPHPTYQINLLMEKDGRESITMTYINSILEDVFMTIETNSSASASRLLDKSIQYIMETFNYDEPCTFIYNKTLNSLGKTKITSKMIEEFKNIDLGIDIEPLYLAQHNKTTPIVKIYNAMYLCLKTYVNKGIQNKLIYLDGKADSRNNCITVEGNIDDITSFYRFLMYQCANIPIISQLIDTVKVSMNATSVNLPTGKDVETFVVVLPNVNVDSMTYLRCITDTDYMVYLETMERYKKDTEEINKRIKNLNDIVDNTVADYFIVDCKEDDGTVDTTMILADSLSVSDSIPALASLLGNVETNWIEDEDDFDTNSDTDSETIDIIANEEMTAEESLDIRMEKISEYELDMNFNINLENFDLSLLNKELTKVGLNGYQAIPRKIIKWGEENSNLHIHLPKPNLNADEPFSDLQYILVDGVTEKLYITEKLPLLNTITTDLIYDLVIKNKENFSDAVSDRQVIPTDILDENAKLIDIVFAETKAQIKEMVSDISSREKLEVLFCQIMLGDFDTDIVSKIVRNLNKQTLKEIFGEKSKTLMARYKQDIIKAITLILMNSARTYRLEKSKLKNNKIDYTKFTYSEDNLNEMVDYVFGD